MQKNNSLLKKKLKPKIKTFSWESEKSDEGTDEYWMYFYVA
jgi:hypothetical protein